jgi:hypothetical protein
MKCDVCLKCGTAQKQNVAIIDRGRRPSGLEKATWAT